MRVRTHTNPFNYHHRLKRIELPSLFPQFNGNLDFEVGFGRGIFLRKWAENHPDRYIIGAEIRKNITDILKERIDKLELTNTHLIHGNGEIILEDCFEDHTLDNIFVFHPDPWFKKKHHKRRVIRPQFLEIAPKKLKPTGKLHISTDVTILWEAMMESIEETKHFKPIENQDFWENDYMTHWHEFSERDNRDFNYGSFELWQ